MRKLSQLQYTVIFLYSKGLTFKEIDTALRTASRGVYSQVVEKDKGRVTRAKISKKKNVITYKKELDLFISEVKINNKEIRKLSSFIKYNSIISIIQVKESFRLKYISDSLDKAYSSYSRYKLTFIKNHFKKVA